MISDLNEEPSLHLFIHFNSIFLIFFGEGSKQQYLGVNSGNEFRNSPGRLEFVWDVGGQRSNLG